MTKEVEPSVKDDVAAVRLAMGYAAKGTVSSGGSVRPNGLAAFDRILHQLQEAEERARFYFKQGSAAARGEAEARSERDAAIERLKEAGDLLQQWSDIENGASIYLGHKERLLPQTDAFLRENGLGIHD